MEYIRHVVYGKREQVKIVTKTTIDIGSLSHHGMRYGSSFVCAPLMLMWSFLILTFDLIVVGTVVFFALLEATTAT